MEEEKGGNSDKTSEAKSITVDILEPKTVDVKVNISKNVEAKISVPKKSKKPTKKTANKQKSIEGVSKSKKATKNKPKPKTTPKKSTQKSQSTAKKPQTPHKSAKTPKRKRHLLKPALITLAILAIPTAILLAIFLIGPTTSTPVIYSHDTGLYTEDITLELSLKDLNLNEKLMTPVSAIRYTLNGDDPRISGTVYSGPIRLELTNSAHVANVTNAASQTSATNQTNNANQTSTTTSSANSKLTETATPPNVYPLKTTYCYANGACTTPQIKTFILSNNPEKDIPLDLISLTSAHDNLYSYDRGIMVPGKTFDDNVKNGADPDAGFVDGNYNNRDESWIRDAEVILYDTDTEQIKWDQNIGIQISGHTSVLDNAKSLKLVANKKYGYDKLAYSFGESGSSASAVNALSAGQTALSVPKKYNSLRIRSGGQDKWSGNIRSSLVSRLAEQSGFDGYSATRRAVAYLNGEFYGLFDVQQNYSDSFLKNRFNLENSDDIEKFKGGEYNIFADAGLTGLFEKDLNVAKNREALEQMVDMDNYLLYFALEILWNNTDWPQNSFEMWRYNGEKIENNPYSDGRWRFLIYDTDVIYSRDGNLVYFEGQIEDQFKAIMEGKNRAYDSTFVSVMESTYYRQKFVSILKELLSGPFKTENILKIVDSEASIIEPAIKLYSTPEEYESWQKQIELLRLAVQEQAPRLKDDVYEYFGIRL